MIVSMAFEVQIAEPVQKTAGNLQLPLQGPDIHKPVLSSLYKQLRKMVPWTQWDAWSSYPFLRRRWGSQRPTTWQ
jgi:hypothetical protein